MYKRDKNYPRVKRKWREQEFTAGRKLNTIGRKTASYTLNFVTTMKLLHPTNDPEYRGLEIGISPITHLGILLQDYGECRLS